MCVRVESDNPAMIFLACYVNQIMTMEAPEEKSP